MKININLFLVKRLKISHDEASKIIQQNEVFINGISAKQKQEINLKDEVIAKGITLNSGKNLFYYAWYKPVGIESTLNEKIENNLLTAIEIEDKFFPLGRLDKASEGLMILTNDGSIYPNKELIFSDIEKEYEVYTDKIIDEKFIEQMQNGVIILGRKTKPCIALKTSDFSFRIILKQGLNRQIRRMCYKLGYEVVKLKRIRFGKFELNNMKPGELISISKSDVV